MLFKPSLKNDFAKITLVGWTFGELGHTYLTVHFSVMGLVRAEPMSIQDVLREIGDESTHSLLINMGYSYDSKQPEITTDEDGFPETYELLTGDEQIERFLKGCKGKHFLAKVVLYSDGWEIDPRTIEPFVSKVG